jgi:hypothetical protein
MLRVVVTPRLYQALDQALDMEGAIPSFVLNKGYFFPCKPYPLTDILEGWQWWPLA